MCVGCLCCLLDQGPIMSAISLVSGQNLGPASSYPPSPLCTWLPRLLHLESSFSRPARSCLSSLLGPSKPGFEALRSLSPPARGRAPTRTGHFWAQPGSHSVGVSRRISLSPSLVAPLLLLRVESPHGASYAGALRWFVLSEVPSMGSVRALT